MPANGASASARPDLALLNDRRSAHASIRGYLYQTCLGVLRWLDLQPNEILLCEGDEDLDRFLLHGGAVSEQVKAYTGGLSITDRVVRDALRNFLRTYVILRQRGENRKFVFTTTAFERIKRTDGLDFDLLKKWKAGERTQEIIKNVRSLVKPNKTDKKQKETEEALAWLDQQDEEWSEFMNAVEWSFSAPELDTLRDQIEGKLFADRAAMAPAQLLDRLVVHVLRTSSQGEIKKRILTREILDTQISLFLTDLVRWSGSPEGLSIRTVFKELDDLRDLLDEGARDLPVNPTPGQILTAAYEVIPFDEAGRREELDFLASWCASEERRSVLLLTGEGGSGKTRLMLEWCRRLRHQGWHAGFLMRNRENHLLSLLKGTAPRLAVIDYSETQLEIVRALLIELGQAPQTEGPKLRIVLLARREGDWWRNLSQLTGDVESLLTYSKSRKISALIPHSLGERQQAFGVAVMGFSKILDRQLPKGLHVPDLSDASFERVLYLHMIAYLTLSGEKIETAEEALRQTLSHEERFWGQQDRDLRQALESTVAAVTLLGGVFTFQEFRALLDRVLPPFSLEPREVRTLQNRLQDLYRGSVGHFLEPLQPDLLGEQLVMEALSHDDSLLERVLDGATPEESYSILTVLTRLTQRRSDQRRWIEEGLRSRLESLAEAAVNVAVRVGDPIGQILAAELRLQGSKELIIRLQQLCAQDQYIYSVPLREVVLFTLERARELLLEERKRTKHPSDSPSHVEYAKMCYRLCNIRGELGLTQSALEVIQEAATIQSILAEKQPDTFLPDYAASLNIMSIVLGDLGQHSEALQSALDAVRIRRKLSDNDHVTFGPKLASSLINLGLQYGRQGEIDSALKVTNEAVDIRRKFAKDGTYSRGLALALNNLAVQLTWAGDTQQALEKIQEAVEIWRNLVSLRPDRFLPDLARSLQNLGRILRALKLYEDALRATTEASKIHEQLADQRADFQPRLIVSLNEQSLTLEEMGRTEEAGLVQVRLKKKVGGSSLRQSRQSDWDQDERGTDSTVFSTGMGPDPNYQSPGPRLIGGDRGGDDDS
jgi:tetratricopeptide (TPR) repeat protein